LRTLSGEEKVATRDDILDLAKDLINGDRASHYGPADENHRRIAALWNTYIWDAGLSRQLTEADVACLMILLKVARLAHSTENARDSFVDICGYAAIAAEMAEQ
jgi:hypothetical protein